MEDIEALLKDSRNMLVEIERLHGESVERGELVEPIKPRIKNVLEHQRSALDYLAGEVFEHHGKRRAPRKIYFPSASKPEHFPRNFDANLPGVRTAYPAVFEAFERHQPYQQGKEWRKWLSQLVNPNKHRNLSKQSTVAAKVWHGPGGLTVIGGTFVDQTGRESADPTGFFVDEEGNQIQFEQAEEQISWYFNRPKAPVLITLILIQQGIEETVQDIRQVAGL